MLRHDILDWKKDRESSHVVKDGVPKRTSACRDTKKGAAKASSSSAKPTAKKVKQDISVVSMTKKEYKELRWDTNPYDYPRDKDLEDDRFHTHIQKSIYEDVILGLNQKIAPQKAIDFKHIDDLDDHEWFRNIHELCQRLGLAHIMKFENYYNEK